MQWIHSDWGRLVRIEDDVLQGTHERKCTALTAYVEKGESLKVNELSLKHREVEIKQQNRNKTTVPK